MKLRSFICIILSITLLSAMPTVYVSATNNKGISLSAKSAILIDAAENNILYEKNANARLPMASTTKIMTALVASELLSLDTMITIPKEATGIEGSSIYLCEDEQLTVKELLYALLLESANDAAAALAICSAGSIEAFAQKCNEKAASLMLKDSNFTNPHGLYEEDHYTTAHDLAIISAEALKNSDIREITSTKKIQIPLGRTKENPNGNGIRVLANHNKMLKSYNGAIGVKTGFTKKSGRCLVSAAERNGLTLIAVTLNAPNDWQDHTAMLDFGFENFEYRTFFDKNEFFYKFPLTNGMSEYIEITNSSPLGAVIPKEDNEYSQSIEATFRFAFAPIQKGEIIAKLKLNVNGKELTSPLVAAYGVDSKDKKNNFFKFN